MLDAFLNFLYGYAVGFFHVPAKRPNLGKQLLRNTGGAVHHEVGVGNTLVDFFNAGDGQNIAGWLFGKFVCAMACANRNRQCIALRRAHKISSLLDIG